MEVAEVLGLPRAQIIGCTMEPCHGLLDRIALADEPVYRTRFLGHQGRLAEIRLDRPNRDARRAS